MDHRLLADRVRSSHGVLSPALLTELGITDRQRLRRLASGEWRRLPSGVIVVSAARETFEMFATAALVAMPESVLSHSSAAQVHGKDLEDERIHVTLTPGGRTRLGGVVVHRSSYQVAELEPFGPDLELAAADPRDVEEIVDETRELIALAVDDPLNASRRLFPRRRMGQDVRGIANRGEWVAQLVREHGEELVLAAVGLA